MQYVMLIHAAESRFAALGPAGAEKLMGAYGEYTRELAAGARVGDCAALTPTHAATSVRVREGKRSVVDGPFAETREQLGGYYSLSAETEEEALGWAAKIPDARGGVIEVRGIGAMPPGAPQTAEAPRFTAETHAQYVFLLYESDAARAAPGRDAVFARYLALNEALKASGHFIAGAPLSPAATAKCVSLRGDARVVRDGPYAETREQLGGYYRVWAKSLDEAVALAARVPAAETGTVEVRPVMDTSRYA